MLLTVISITFMGVAGLSYYWILQTKQSVSYLSGEVLDANKASLRLRTRLDEINNHFANYLALNQYKDFKSLEKLNSKFLTELDSLKKQSFSREIVSGKVMSSIESEFKTLDNAIVKTIKAHDRIKFLLTRIRTEYKTIDIYFDDELQKLLASGSKKPFQGINNFLKKHSNSLSFLKSITPHLEVYSTDENLLAKVQSALDMEINVDETFIAMEGYVSHPEKQLLVEFDDAIQDFGRYKSVFLKQKLTKNERIWGNNISNKFHENVLKAREVIKLTDFKIKSLIRVDDIFNKIRRSIEELSTSPIESHTEQTKKDIDNRYERMKQLVVVAVGILLSISFLAILYLLRTVVVPLGRISKIVSATDINNLPESLPVYVKNEVGITARSIERMISRLKQEIKEKEVTERKMYQNSRLASIGELAAGVAHEINNPLAIVRLSIDDLEKEVDCIRNERPGIDKELKIQKEAIERISLIVKSLRHYTHMDIDTVEDINVNEAVNDTLAIIEPILNKNKIRVKKSITNDDNFISGNIGKLKQVFLNIITNAKDALESSDLKEIDIKVYQEEECVVIEVTDSGEGIDSDSLPRIFDAFYTTKPPGKGSGMGLNICQKFVQEMNGTLEISSRKDEGTKVTMKFHTEL